MSEINFGKYAVVTPIEHRFEQEPDWFWKIKPVSSGDELEMQKFLWQRRVQVTNGVREEIPPVNMEIIYREIALSFAGTNIPKTTIENDEVVVVTDTKGEVVPILYSNANVGQIEAVLKQMPTAMIMEVWKAVGEANPTWGPGDQKKAS
jgi:hypothetical protein